jgi:hypothetical protein
MVSLNSLTQTGLNTGVVTAKDSFLKNPDLMAMTFSHLQCRVERRLGLSVGYVRIKKSRRCLLNAALTCKDFLDVAVDALWEKMNSLVPLLKLLPALQIEDNAYVGANVHVFLYDLILPLGP